MFAEHFPRFYKHNLTSITLVDNKDKNRAECVYMITIISYKLRDYHLFISEFMSHKIKYQ